MTTPDRFREDYDPDPYYSDRPDPSEYADLDTPRTKREVDPEVYVQHEGEPF